MPMSTAATPRPRIHRAWWVLVACCLMFGSIVGLIGNSAGLYLRPVADELGTNLASLNGYLTVVSLVMTVTLPIAGWVLPRVPIQWVCAAALTLACGTYSLSSTFTTLGHWYVAGVLLGIGYGFLMYIPIPLIINNWFRRRNGLAIGIGAAFASTVAAVANPIAGAAIDSVGWRQTRLVVGIVAWLMATPAVIALIRFKPESLGLRPYGADEADAQAAADGAPAAGRSLAVRDAVRTVPFWCTVVLAGLLAFAASMLQQAPSHATTVGLSAATGAGGVSAIMIGGILGKLGLGQLHDRRGVVGTALVAVGFGAVGAAIVIASGSAAGGFLVGCAVFGVAYAALTVVPPLVVRHFFGTADYSRVYSLVTIALGLFSALAPVTYARVYDVTGSFSGAWGLAIGAYAVVAVLILVAQRASRRTAPVRDAAEPTPVHPREGARP